MKQSLTLFIFVITHSCLTAQNVGIGTTSPMARFHVADSSVLFFAPNEATIFPGNPPISGAGRRMMWYPDKGAFRTGYVSADQWDKNNVGYYSFASGYDARANGGFSTAFGGGSIANGPYSTAMGYSTFASGFGSAAFGFRGSAKAYGGISLGALNDDTDNPDAFNATSSDRIFQIGNGDINTLSRSNAITVLRNGNTGIGITSPLTTLHVKSSSDNPVIFDGANGMWVTLAENGTERGYIGSYAGNAEDVELGTYSGTTGSVHLSTSANPRLTVINNGNVGIGTTAPDATLEVMRGTGNSGTAAFQGTNYTSHFNYSTNEDTYIRAGKNGGNVILNDVTGGKVGVGTSTPGFPLNFPNTTGDKISLWGNTGSHYGFGIQNALLQIHTDGAGSDIAFGHGSSGSLVEKFRMKGNGAFVVNGSAGSAGQILTSNGNASSPSWTNPLSTLYNNMTEYTQSSPVVMVPQTSYQLPGMTNISLVITSPSIAIVSASVEVERTACGGCGSSEASLLIQTFDPVTNVAISTNYVFPSEKVTPVVGMKFLTLNPGTYTLRSYLVNGIGSNATARSGRLNIIIVPQ